MDMSQYTDLFISEARQYARTIGGLIVDLEKNAGDREKIDALFRAAHSIKGMAASMDFRTIAELAHKLEDLMSRVRKETLAFDSGVADLLLEGADVIELLINDVEQKTAAPRDVSGLVHRVATYEPVTVVTSEQRTAVVEDSPSAEAPGSGDVAARPAKAELQQTVRVKTTVLDHLINITGELITNKHRLVNITGDLTSARLTEAVTELTKLLRVLHNEVMQVRLMPLAVITDRFPRMVRDLARKGGKDADFIIEGEDIELDRSILEELSDPLIHILRNAVDHGLEPAEVRSTAGKPAKGRISLSARRERDQVILVIEDDGRGMDPDRILKLALERGFVTPEAAALLSPQEIFLLTCLPGFSTAPQVTDVSGRGVGMDAVRATIHSLCGTLSIESEIGRGSRIILKLPFTVAIVNVLLMCSGPIVVAVPVMNIIRTLELRHEMILRHDRLEKFLLDGEEVPLLRLNDVFAMEPAPSAPAASPLFIAEVKGRKVGVVVDAFLGHQEVFVKPLGRPLDKLKGVAGGAVLGDGRLIFILDVANLV